MKIGIFGGCFNPPHKMHKQIAIYFLENKILDKVIYVPVGNHYNKPDLASDIDRYNMLKIMVNDKRIEISNFEMNNSLKYTYQTLDYFNNLYKEDEIYFITGSDNLKQIDTWVKSEYLLKNYKFLIIGRNNDDYNQLISKYKKYKNNFYLVDIPEVEICSTQIRELLKDNSVDKLFDSLDKNVIKYIQSRNLYK
jgi:nicotinate-nucleotide adenylyltransferase